MLENTWTVKAFASYAEEYCYGWVHILGAPDGRTLVCAALHETGGGDVCCNEVLSSERSEANIFSAVHRVTAAIKLERHLAEECISHYPSIEVD